ncbi:uncharacterized protein LOC112051058 [Bicyclus anynana]|uniref:Uncharacterized protein LOC112051058 n=1 Tax=Bicyclus anynana TaxID=110368 RepID=A0A6J1NK28_BICAN|nr:uncharacterized protein LOC112051058 [Bicyclus anynana]
MHIVVIVIRVYHKSTEHLLRIRTTKVLLKQDKMLRKEENLKNPGFYVANDKYHMYPETELVLKKKLSSTNRSSSSNPNNDQTLPRMLIKRHCNRAIENINPKRTKVDKTRESTEVTVKRRHSTTTVSGSSRRNQSMIEKDNPLIYSVGTDDAGVRSVGEKITEKITVFQSTSEDEIFNTHQSSSSIHLTKERALPIPHNYINDIMAKVDACNELITTHDQVLQSNRRLVNEISTSPTFLPTPEYHNAGISLQQWQNPHHLEIFTKVDNKSNVSQQTSPNDTIAAPATTLKPSATSYKHPQLDQHTQLPNISYYKVNGKSYQNLIPRDSTTCGKVTHQRLSQNIKNNTPYTHHLLNCKRAGSQLCDNMKSSSSSLVERKAHLSKQYRQEITQAPAINGGYFIKESRSNYKLNGVDKTCAAHNLPNVPYEAPCSTQQPIERQHLPSKENHFHQIPQVRNMPRKIHATKNIDQSLKFCNNLNQTHKQNELNLERSFNYFLSQNENQQNDQDYLKQQRLGEEQSSVSTECNHNDHPIPEQSLFHCMDIPNRVPKESEKLQKNIQSPWNHQFRDTRPQNIHSDVFKIKNHSQNTKKILAFLRVLKETQTLPDLRKAQNLLKQYFSTAQGNNYLQNPRAPGRLNERTTKQNEMSQATAAAAQNIAAEPVHILQNFNNVQSSSLSDRSHVNQNPLFPKMVVEQSTKNSMKHIHFKGGILEPSAIVNHPTDKCFSDERQLNMNCKSLQQKEFSQSQQQSRDLSNESNKTNSDSPMLGIEEVLKKTLPPPVLEKASKLIKRSLSTHPRKHDSRIEIWNEELWASLSPDVKKNLLLRLLKS